MTDQLAQAARELLDVYDKLTPEELARMSPAERRMVKGIYTAENIEVLRELAEPSQESAQKRRPNC